MEKPIISMNDLIDAQQKVIRIYQAYKRVTEKDVYRILKLNPELACDDSSLEDNASFGDIRRFVSHIAHRYYTVLEYGEEADRKVSRRMKIGEYTNFFNNQYKYIRDRDADYDGDAMKDDVLKPHQQDMEIAEMEHERNREYRERLIQDAEKKLSVLLLSKGYFTSKDVNSALGIRTDAPDHVLLELDAIDRLDADGIREKVHWYVKDAHMSVYQAERDLPCELTPVRMWSTPGGYTTVEWSDHTKTTVRAENEETATTYGGFCACVAKKLYNRSTDAIGLMNRALDRAAWPAKRKQIEREKLKKMKRDKVEYEKKAREKMIHHIMETKRIEREAERRLEQQEGDIEW